MSWYEGLVAVLGVPLLLGSGSGGKVIGALFASSRASITSLNVAWRGTLRPRSMSLRLLVHHTSAGRVEARSPRVGASCLGCSEDIDGELNV